ncbi:hypothetical protein SEEC0818_020570 [Salmonella enterica subsp. enterica serovar Cerro str. 818]
MTRWLDTSLLELMYGNDTQNLIGMQNSGDGLLMQFVLGTMFIVLPVFWIGAVSWAGIQTGNSLDGILKTVQTNVTPKMRNKKQSSYGYDDDEN